MLLETRDLTLAYGGIVAVRSVSIKVPAGSIVAVIGANGAGKTTLMAGIIGQLKPRGGRVIYRDRDVTGAAPHRLVRSGLTLVPQNRGTLSPLTVHENLLLAAQRLKSRRAILAAVDEAYEMFPILRDRRAVAAGMLSGGEQQMLAFGRAILTRPTLMLLDEPSTGLSPAMTELIMEATGALRQQGITALIVEQNVSAVLAIADRVYVLDRGNLVQEGDAAQMRDDDGIRTAFLGL